MAGRKRLLKEIEKLDNLEKPLSNATVHGVATLISPVKKGRACNFFDGALTDGSTKVCLVGFNSAQQRNIKQFVDSKEALQLSDCEIKQARRGSNMEIMLKGTTEIKASPRKFKISKIDLDETHHLRLN